MVIIPFPPFRSTPQPKDCHKKCDRARKEEKNSLDPTAAISRFFSQNFSISCGHMAKNRLSSRPFLWQSKHPRRRRIGRSRRKIHLQLCMRGEGEGDSPPPPPPVPASKFKECPVAAAAAAQETLVMSTCDVMAKRPPPRRQRISPLSRSSAESIGLDGRTFFGAMRNIFSGENAISAIKGKRGRTFPRKHFLAKFVRRRRRSPQRRFHFHPPPPP